MVRYIETQKFSYKNKKFAFSVVYNDIFFKKEDIEEGKFFGFEDNISDDLKKIRDELNLIVKKQINFLKSYFENLGISFFLLYIPESIFSNQNDYQVYQNNKNKELALATAFTSYKKNNDDLVMMINQLQEASLKMQEEIKELKKANLKMVEANLKMEEANLKMEEAKLKMEEANLKMEGEIEELKKAKLANDKGN